MRRIGASILLAVLAAGCTVGPDYVPDDLPVPSEWNEAQASADREMAAAALAVWWAQFHDPLLDRLIGDAISDNEDLKIARQRLIEARASRAVAASVNYPQVKAEASRTNSRSSTTVEYPPGIGEFHTWVVGFDASWEIDIFGGTQRSIEAAEANIGVAIEDRRAILVSLLAEIASDYAGLRADQLRLDIARRNITSSEKSVDLTQQELSRGIGTDLEVAQAKSQLETVQATLPPLEASEARYAHAIGVLLGRFPAELEVELKSPVPLMEVPADLPVSLPSEIVENRPDIRRAERRYAAATAEIGVATSDLFPHFSIPLLLEPTSSTIHSLFWLKSWEWNFGVAISEIAFDGFKSDAQIVAARANAEASRVAYEQTVRYAFRDVEDALINFQTETRRRERLIAAAKDSDAALDLSTRLYGAGLVDFEKVLDSERAAFAAEDQTALSQLAEVLDVIALFKALGGGWQNAVLDPPTAFGPK